MGTQNMEYAGFWVRVAAALVDILLIGVITSPLLNLIYGPAYWHSPDLIAGPWDFLLSSLFPAVAVIAFWIYRSATPGKILFKLRIVDASTGERASNGQLIGRYFGYSVSVVPLLLGIIWVGCDRRKQGWHDKLAGTLVIREPADPSH